MHVFLIEAAQEDLPGHCKPLIKPSSLGLDSCRAQDGPQRWRSSHELGSPQHEQSSQGDAENADNTAAVLIPGNLVFNLRQFGHIELGLVETQMHFTDWLKMTICTFATS
jgi:hypothetical protein